MRQGGQQKGGKVNEQPKGKCEHGEFILIEGCPKCIAERRAAEQATAQEPPASIVKVKYKLTKNAGTDKEVVMYEGRAYTYFALEPLVVGNIVEVPVQDHVMKAMVVEVNVPESEIAAFRDRVKTIPVGAKLTDQTTEIELPAAELSPVAQVANLFDTLKPEPARKEFTGVPFGEGVVATSTEGPIVPPALVTIETQVGKPAPELLPLYLEAASLLQVAKTRTITTNEDLKPATDDLAIIAVCKKAMFARKTELAGPLKAKLDLVNKAFDDIMFPVIEADRLTRAQVQTFDNEQRRKATEAQRIEDEKLRLAKEEAALNGTGEHTQELGTAQAPPPVPERTRTDMGTLGGRDNWKARVVDFKLLDDQWKIANESLLNSHARTTKGERPIPGVEFWNDRSVTMRTR